MNTRLGRGLEALLGETLSLQEVLFVPLSCIIKNPFQPRLTFEEVPLQELALSIKEKGILQPLLVRKKKDTENMYELIAGERRLRGAEIAGLATVPCRVLELTDQESLEAALLENIQREDLNAIEEGKGYQKLMHEFSYNQENLAHIVGKSRSHIANLVRLLRLPEKVQQMIQNHVLSSGHGKLLVGREHAEKEAEAFVKHKLSVREAEVFLKKQQKQLQEPFKEKDTEAEDLAEQLKIITHLKSAVKIYDKGALISFRLDTLEELDRFIDALSKGFAT